MKQNETTLPKETDAFENEKNTPVEGVENSTDSFFHLSLLRMF